MREYPAKMKRGSVRLVQRMGHLPVGGPSCFEFLRPLLKLPALLRDFLFHHEDASLELVDIRCGPEPGIAPCLLAELRETASPTGLLAWRDGCSAPARWRGRPARRNT